MEQSEKSKLPEATQEQIWGYLNEINLSLAELDLFKTAYQSEVANKSASLVRLDTITKTLGESKLEGAMKSKISQIENQIRSSDDRLEEIRRIFEENYEFINNYVEKLKDYIKSLPSNDLLIIHVSNQLKTVLQSKASNNDLEDQNKDQTIDFLLKQVSIRNSLFTSVRNMTGKNVRIKKNKKSDIFLCHSKRDKVQVRKLYEDLKKSGFNPWLDEVDILPGQDWELEILLAIKKAKYFIACISKKAVDRSGYLHKEIKVALDILDQMPERKIFLIPLRLENCAVPERLRSRQWVNLFDVDGYDKLVKALGSN